MQTLQKGVLPSQNALKYVTIQLKILLASPKITLLQIQILIISLFQYLLLIGKLQQMVCLVELIIAGIQKVLFPLWFAVIAVCHHQIPVYTSFSTTSWVYLKEYWLLPIYLIMDALTVSSFTSRRAVSFILFASFYCSLRQNPSLILVLVILIKDEDFPSKYNHTAAARCFNHCNSSWCWCEPDLRLYRTSPLQGPRASR